jgi:DNA-binding NarL/FixJ family response regulator
MVKASSCDQGPTPPMHDPACPKSQSRTRVFVIDEVRLLRDALVRLLSHAGLEIVGAGAVCAATIGRLAEISPDVTVIDMPLAGSLAVLRAVVAAAPTTKIVVLGMPETEMDVLAHRAAPVEAYVDPEASVDEFVRAVVYVNRGAAQPLQSQLTKREAEIADLIADGLSDKQIASHLSIGLRTVKNHVHNILQKLHFTSRIAVVRAVMEERANTDRRRITSVG